MRTTAPVLQKHFSQHSIEVVIARVEKDKPSFHRDPILAV